MNARLLLPLVAAAAITLWRSATAPPSAGEILRTAKDPAALAWAIRAGGPADEEWLAAIRPWSQSPTWRPVILATLLQGDPWPPGLVEFVEDAARNGTDVERRFAQMALDRHAELAK